MQTTLKFKRVMRTEERQIASRRAGADQAELIRLSKLGGDGVDLGKLSRDERMKHLFR